MVFSSVNEWGSGDGHRKLPTHMPEASQGSSLDLPVGTILPYVGKLSDIPSGWHLCDGSVGTPNLSGQFLEGTTSVPKTFKEAGLPNITGWFGNMEENSALFGGAISPHRTSSGAGSDNYGGINGYFDASKSNPIYGRSNTVQPASYTVYYIMRIK